MFARLFAFSISIAATQLPAQRAFTVGERVNYDVYYVMGMNLHAGTGSLQVVGIDSVRGHAAYHFRLVIQGSALVVTIIDTLQSWADTSTLRSLRFHQDAEQSGKKRTRRYEIFPERATFSDAGKPEQPSVPEPLDDISFLFFIRTVALDVGETLSFNDYFKPASNPVIVKVLRRETIQVAGKPTRTVVIQPVIKTSGYFGEGGEAQLWLTDDAAHRIVQLRTKLAFGTLEMRMTSVTAGGRN
ncbi:MAG TPA: DUF3108 domain-containing protein [Gemmatimonadaceae bacterium]|nr:DUF3108 domain-containing protein [Gemmatimonadaceae bacterium]